MTENIMNIMLPNMTLGEITLLDLLSGLTDISAGVIIEATTGDEIIKVVMALAITPITALIMAPSKTLRLRKALEALEMPQEYFEKSLSKTPEMVSKIYYITKNITLSNMTSGEIILKVLSSVLLGATIGVNYNLAYIPSLRPNSSFTNEIDKHAKLKTLSARVLAQVQIQVATQRSWLKSGPK